MDTIDDIYYAFGQNFIFASVLFLPDSLLQFVEGEVKENLRDITNSIIIVERNGKNYLLDVEQNSGSIHVLFKKALLDDNILILLGFRENNPKKSFDYVLRKYLDQLGGYTYFSKWLFENARTYINNLTKDTMNALELQYNTFLDHADDMGQQFPMGDETKISVVLESANDKSASQLGDLLQYNHLDKLLQVAPKRTEVMITAKERKASIRKEIESSADRLILKSVFNVRMKNE